MRILQLYDFCSYVIFAVSPVACDGIGFCDVLTAPPAGRRRPGLTLLGSYAILSQFGQFYKNAGLILPTRPVYKMRTM